MSELITELMNALLRNEAIGEGFRQHVEKAVNDILQAELSSFLGYQKYDSSGWGSGNSRNGSYQRTFETKYGELHVVVPRDRNGEFHQQTLLDYQRRSDDRFAIRSARAYRIGCERPAGRADRN